MSAAGRPGSVAPEDPLEAQVALGVVHQQGPPRGASEGSGQLRASGWMCVASPMKRVQPAR